MPATWELIDLVEVKVSYTLPVCLEWNEILVEGRNDETVNSLKNAISQFLL